jgi:hypothetical protein
VAIKVSNGKDTFEVDEHKLDEAKADGFVPTVKVTNGKDVHDVHPNDLHMAEADGYSPIDSDESGFLDTISKVGNKIDSYTGAPTRAAIGAIQDGENPIKAFGKQFGNDPETAPTGKQIAQKAGVSSKPLFNVDDDYLDELEMQDPRAAATLRGVKAVGDIPRDTALGVAVDVAADPTLLVPFGKVGTLAKGGAQLAGRGALKAGVAGAELAARGAKALPGAEKAAVAAEKVGTVFDIAKDTAKNTTEALKTMFKPTVAEDFKDLSSIAQKNGIDPKLLPESIEFGQNSFISRAARNRAEGVLGEPHLKRFEQGLDAVRGATENKIADIGGGHIHSNVEAGEIIRNGFDKGVDNFFEKAGMTHGKIIEAIPNLQLAPESAAKIEAKLNGIEKWAKGRAVRGITQTDRTQADQLLRAVEAVREGKNYKQTHEALRDIGNVAFKAKNVLADIPPDVQKLRDLYFTIDDALIETAGKVGGAPVAQELKETNKAIHDFIGDKSVISSIVGNKNMSPEKVFTSLVEHGDSKKIEALKKILPKEDFQKLKGAFLESQLKRNADGSFSFKTFHNSLRNKKNVLGSLLSPEEINDLSEVIRLGNRFGDPILSKSGTGASSLFSDIGQGIRSGAESDTVIGLLKDSARKKALAPPKAPQSLARPVESTAAKRSVEVTGNPKTIANYKRLAAISPSIFRGLGVQSGDEKRSPSLKGESAWAVNGAANLIDHDKSGVIRNPQILEKLMSTSKGRSLLAQASDLKPGSKAMNSILMKIKSQYGEKN